MDEVRFAEMISKIAHELRSPLTSLKGFSATLLSRWDRFDDEQRRQLVETIHSDAERMGRLVSEVLDLARLESGRLELRPVIVRVEDLARRALEGLADPAGKERVSLDVAGDLEVWADPDRLSHVLRNLLENAIKFSDAGPVTLRAYGGDDAVHLDVIDQGIGIAPERIGGIFSGPAPAGEQSGPSGSSLGLYLTRKLVDAHGGDISVRSSPGKGSTFSVVLPKLPEEEPSA